MSRQKKSPVSAGTGTGKGSLTDSPNHVHNITNVAQMQGIFSKKGAVE